MSFEQNSQNVIQVGVAFFFIFFAFASSSVIQVTVINHSSEYVSSNVDKYDGYTSLSLIYGVFTFANFFSAPIVNYLGVRLALPLSAISYALFELGFFYLNRIFLYASSIAVGISAAVLWSAQGKYVALNAVDSTARRYSGIFYALYKISLIAGGIFLLIVFHFVETETHKMTVITVRILYGVFSGVTILGIIILSLLKEPNRSITTSLTATTTAADNNRTSSQLKVPQPQLQQFVSTFQLAVTKEMLLMAFVFAYSGVILGFWSSIYPTCIASTQKFRYNTKSLLAISAIVQGMAQVAAAMFISKLPPTTGRVKIVAIGTMLHLLTLIGIFINFPDNSPLGVTDDISMIEPSIVVMLVCSFLLGIGDSFWNTQVTASLITNFPTKSAEAFSLNSFYHSLPSAIIFFYSKTLSLHVHLIILSISVILSLICFIGAEKIHSKRPSLSIN